MTLFPVHKITLTFTGELSVVLARALISADHALDVLLIGLLVQAGVAAAAARALGTVDLRVWCHAVDLLLHLLLRDHAVDLMHLLLRDHATDLVHLLLGHASVRRRDEGGQRRQLLVRGDTGAHRRQVAGPGTVQWRRLGHERHASREVQVERTEVTLATGIEEPGGGWGRSWTEGAPEVRIVSDNSGRIGPQFGASSGIAGAKRNSRPTNRQKPHSLAHVFFVSNM